MSPSSPRVFEPRVLCWSRGGCALALALALACKPQGDTSAPGDSTGPAVVEPEPASADSSSPAAAPDPTAALPAVFVDAAAKLEVAVGRPELERRAWERLAELVDRFGHRLSGSRSLEQAIDWSLEQMRSDGLTEVRREKVMVPRWVRGKERARVLAPVERELELLGLGNTVGTGRKPIRAPIVVVHSIDELKQRGAEAVKGKIVVINQAMPAYDHATHDSGYGPTVQIRVNGPSEAARLGARAVLIRSVTAASLSTPHTGTLRYEEGVEKIPAAALTVEHTEMLTRMAARGPVEVELSLGAKTLPDAESGNAIGELRGRELPDEIVVVGCHIDSWDVGEGAQDDGAGCVMAMEAARMLKELGLVPRRTVRVVLFTNEENGLRGGVAYHAAHKQEKHVGAIESDAGCGAPWGFGLTGPDEQVVSELIGLAPLFAPLGAGNLHKGGGGADISPLMKDGVLGVGVHPDTSHYFDIHHTKADTVEKIDPAHIRKNAAAMALMAFILAER